MDWLSRLFEMVTVRGRHYSAAAGSLVREAMRKRWNGKPALAVAAMHVEVAKAARRSRRRRAFSR